MIRLYKEGNIGLKEIFINHKCIALFNHNVNTNVLNEPKNIIDQRFFLLDKSEISIFEKFILRASLPEFAMLKPFIDEFVWGLEQIDRPTGFEQYTTALEMLLLEQNQQGKKEALSKRVAVLLGNSDSKIQLIYSNVKNYYRYRSESLHDGNGSNITEIELYELEDIVRQVINIYLDFCKDELVTNPLATWDVLKTKKIDELKMIVMNLKTRGVLPNQIKMIGI